MSARKYQCRTCEDWGTVVRPDGRGTEPCPDPIHQRTTTSPVQAPAAGEALEADRRQS